jgi:hypothetical protein
VSKEFLDLWEQTLRNILALGEEHEPAVFTRGPVADSGLANYCGAASFILVNAVPVAHAADKGEAAVMLAAMTHAVTDRVLRETDVPAAGDDVEKRLRFFHRRLNKAARKVLVDNNAEVYMVVD